MLRGGDCLRVVCVEWCDYGLRVGVCVLGCVNGIYYVGDIEYTWVS